MEADRRAATSAGTNAFLARFEKQVDPDGLLPVDERQRRAQNALRAHMIMDQGTAQEVVPSQQQLPI